MSLPCKINPLGVYRLPIGYLPARFLESTGTQYINTGIRPFTGAEKCTVGLEIDCLATGPGSSSTCMIAGCGASGSAWFSPYRWWNEEAAYAVLYLQQHAYPVSSPYNNGIRCSLNFLESGVVKYSANGGDVKTVPITHAVKDLAQNIMLFGGGYGSPPPRAAARIWSSKISDGAALERAYVPTISPTGVPCMYDRVTRQPFFNSGSGSFIIGLTSKQATKLANLPAGGGELTVSLPQGDVTDAGEVYTEAIKTAFDTAAANGWTLAIQTYGDELPGGCVPCEFLESTGTQYIDTGIAASADINVKTTWEWTGQYTGTSQYVYGGYHQTFASLCSTATYATPHFYANGKNVSFPDANTGVQTFEHTWYSATNNGTTKTFADHDELTTWPSLRLFSGSGYYAIIRIFKFTIAKSGEKQCNYTPIITAAGVPAMWDSVTRTAKYNAGTGSFVVGLTAENALKLANLPVTTGGTLTISLPSEVVDENGVLQDMAIFTALSQAAAKGWSFILQTHDGTTVETTVPAGYMECEFLESTGTQYLDTGIIPDNETSIRCLGTFSANTNESIFGTKNSGDYLNGVYCIRLADAGGYNALIRGANQCPEYSALGTKLAISATPTEMSINDRVTAVTSELSATYSLFVFARSNFGNPLCGKVKVFNFAIANADTPQANYVPIITADGVPAMWDYVSKTAKLNSGTGSFIVGMTAAQAVQLANLPTGGGALTLSLPQSILNDDGEITDAAVRAALNKAADNGWTITLQYYTEQ